MKKGFRFSVYAIIILIASCNSHQKKNTLRIAVAANLRFVMEEVNEAFKSQTGINVDMVTASSGKLTSQIKSGAPYDIFMSANFKYPNSLYKEGFSYKPVLLCNGKLVIWSNKGLKIDSLLNNLTCKSIGKIAIANPQNAPYGIAAKELLINLSIYDSVATKLVFAENVSQLNQYVLNKSVDAGITAKSAVLAPKLKTIGEWKEISTEYYSPVEQYIVRLKKAKSQSNQILKYLEFLSSSKAKRILANYGYSTNEI